MTRINVPTRAEERCPTCGTTHWLSVEYDEDGPYVDLDTDVCNQGRCTKQLCEACPKWTCPMCLLAVCADHPRVEMLDRGQPVTVCEACAADPGDLTRPDPRERMVLA